MNNNILAVIFSFIQLEELGKFSLVIKEKENLFENCIDYLCLQYNTTKFNIVGKIYNSANKCGICFNNLTGTYTVRFGLVNCLECQQKLNFNIEICRDCSKYNLLRGESYIEYCQQNHKIIYFGINFLSF